MSQKNYLDITYSCNIQLLVTLGQGYDYRSWRLQNSYSGGEVERAQGNIAGADYGTGWYSIIIPEMMSQKYCSTKF